MIWKPHATVAAIIERDNKFLMVEEMVGGKKQINQPAGHLDPDESLIDAAIRETREETAWGFTPEAVTGIYLWKHPENGESFLRVSFCGPCHDHHAEQSLDDGILRAIWLTRDELIARQGDLRSPMVITCIDDYLSGKRFPLEMLVDIAT
jgi:8-oxo-dGTP pyrophosphatase MutT (NUDIX family)